MAHTGRPRKFDRDKAVMASMELFWKHGFEGTSLERLRQAMGGLSSASFYATLSPKRRSTARFSRGIPAPMGAC